MRRACVVIAMVVMTSACASSSSSAGTSSLPGAQAAPVRDPATIPCPLLRDDEAFLEHLLARWRVMSKEDLKLGERPLPWAVLVGRECVYQLAPRRLPDGGKTLTTALMWNGGPLVVHAMGHNGTVTLPDGETIEAGTHAFGRKTQDGDELFVLSLMELWSAHPEVSKQASPPRAVVGIALQELTRMSTAESPSEGDDPTVSH